MATSAWAHYGTAERESVLRDGLGYVAAHGVGKLYAPVMKYLLAELLLDLGRWMRPSRSWMRTPLSEMPACRQCSDWPTEPGSPLPAVSRRL